MKLTKEIRIGDSVIGGKNPVLIQSMTNTDTRNVNDTVKQIKKLEEVGCEIIRVAVPDMDAANAIKEIKRQISIPLVADIHFDYRLALKSIENGVDKLRINPGNIGDRQKIKEVAAACSHNNIPIRIGVNAGSLDRGILHKYGHASPEALVESALSNVMILEELNFTDIVISIKSSSVPFSIQAYRLLSEKTPYPLHVGITEAGTLKEGSIKSAVGIGAILALGIGDTIRVSLTGDPIFEIDAAKGILKALELRKFGVEFISCPTCGRCEIDLISIANTVEERCGMIRKNIKVAVMGCAVNGPGEAKEADIGIAGGKGEGLIFKRGQIIKKVDEGNLISELMAEIENI